MNDSNLYHPTPLDTMRKLIKVSSPIVFQSQRNSNHPLNNLDNSISFRNNIGSPTTNSSTQESSPSQGPGSAPQGPEEAEADLYVSRAPTGGFVTLHLFKGCWREPGIDILNYEWARSVEDYPGVHRCRDCWPAGWTAEKLTTEILAGRRPASRREDARRARDERDTTDESSSTDVEAVRQARRGARPSGS